MKKTITLILLGLLCSVGTVWAVDIYSTDVKATPTSPATATSDKGDFPASAVSWASNYAYYFLTSGSAGYYTLTFSSALDLTDYTDVKVKVYWGATSNRPLNISVNGGDNTKIDEVTSSSDRSKVREAEGSISVTSLSSIKFVSSGGGNVYLFRIEITGTAAAADVTAPTLSSSDPANSATGVATSGTIVLTFSEAIASVDGSKFSLSGATKGTVAIDGTDAKKVNIPYSEAGYETTITLSTAAEAVADAAGNKSAALSAISFSTKALSYSITYNTGGGSGSMATIENIASGSSQTITANAFTRDCYTFSHWTANVDVTIGGNTVTIGDPIEDKATIQNITSDITLTAQWTPNYASTRDFAAVVNAGTQESNDIATFLAAGNMESSGLSSSEWETGGSPSSEYVGYKLKDTGATIKFLVQAGKKVTITLGNVGAAATLYKDDATSPIAKSTGSGVQTVIPTFTPENDMLVKIVTSSTATVTLKSIVIETPADYTITTSATNGSIDVVSGANENDNVEISATPSTGYEFTSWSIYKTDDTETTITPAATTASTSFTMPAYNVTVSATFTAIDYSITANDAENGTYTVKIGEDEVTTANYGQTITLAATPDDGYCLSAWTVTKASSGTVTVTNNQFTMPAEDVTIAATFSVANTLTYNANGGTGSMANTLGVGSVSLRPNGYKNAGYTFMGWATSQANADAGIVTYADQASYTLSADAELFAVWEESYCHLIPATSGSTISASDVIDMQSGSFGGSIMALSANLSYNAYGLQFGTNSSTKASVTLNDFLKVGSVITMKFTSNGTGSRGLKIYTSDGTKTVATLGWSGDATNGAVGIFRYTVVADDGLEGMKEFQLWRNNTVTMEYLTVVNAQPGGTISEAGWSSYSCNKPLDLNSITFSEGEGAAYVASAASGSTVTLTKSTAKVSAGEGLMIKGTAGETFTIDVAASGTAITGNLLKGQTTTGNVAASTSGAYHYVFGFKKPEEVVTEYGFYNLSAETTIPAGKAYLETATILTTGGSSAPAVIRILDEENNATSIERLDGKKDAIKFIENGQLYILREGVVYDALGRKVR